MKKLYGLIMIIFVYLSLAPLFSQQDINFEKYLKKNHLVNSNTEIVSFRKLV